MLWGRSSADLVALPCALFVAVQSSGVAAGAGAGAAAASSGDALSVASKKSSSTHAQMGQNKQMALERGEKLNQMEDKAARMESDAENFASMAAKLKEKQKNSWW